MNIMSISHMALIVAMCCVLATVVEGDQSSLFNSYDSEV